MSESNSNEKCWNLQSQAITVLRFVLIVMVVMIHSAVSESTAGGVSAAASVHSPIYDALRLSVSEHLCRIAVPLFFVISGYLYFFRVNDFGLKTYVVKLKKRLRTLLIPYVIWNILCMGIFQLGQMYLPGMMSGENKLIADYGVADWLNAFYGGPICYQLWFVRDLMVVVLLFVPLIYWGLKRMPYLFISLLALCWLFGRNISVTGMGTPSIFFFSLGAFFSLRGRNMVSLAMRYWGRFAAVYVLLLAVVMFVPATPLLDNVMIPLGMAAVIGIVGRLLQSGVIKANSFLADSSFFIYVYHALPLILLIKLSLKLLPVVTDGWMVAIYFVCPVLTIAVGLTLYKLGRMLFPRVLAVMTGGR